MIIATPSRQTSAPSTTTPRPTHYQARSSRTACQTSHAPPISSSAATTNNKTDFATVTGVSVGANVYVPTDPEAVHPMRSTMQDFPLTVASDHAVRDPRARRPHRHDGDRATATATTPTARSGEQAARLANALRRLGITGDQRVATFMWNNQEHLEAYLAVPSMGAVLHTLNIRLSPSRSPSSPTRPRTRW